MIESLIAAAANVTSTLPTAATTVAGLAGLTPFAIPFGGSLLCGFFMGWALRKIIKWIVIIAGVILGIIFLALQWLQKSGYINGTVLWDKLGNDISKEGQHLATQINFSNLHGVFGTLGIPVSSGMSLGLLAGFIKAR